MEPLMSDDPEAFDMARRIERAARTAPLSGVDPDAITRAFEVDPLTLSNADGEAVYLELRRRRNAFLSQEAAKAAQGRAKRTKAEPQTSTQAAKLDKPESEISINDLLNDD